MILSIQMSVVAFRLAISFELVTARSATSTLPRHRDILTTQGIVRGYYRPDPPHFAFLGLPYARSPTYDRFKAPEAPPRWDGIFEATYQVKCPQPDGSGTENCLVVNVFLPDIKLEQAPVLVHFHDGDFQTGWGHFYPSHHFISEGIIIITFNHRIGACGFLCLGTFNIPGNAGLKDQIAALYWIQRNIARFNGNPSDVTVYGTGSGAVGIQLLLLSETSKGLFQKAILESGTVLSPSTLSYDTIGDAFIAAAEIGFPQQNIEKLEKLFEKLSIRKLVNISISFLPCLEKDHLTSLISNDPVDTMKHGYFHHIPMIIVYSSAKQVEIIRENIQRFSIPPDKLVDLIPNNLAIDNLSIRHQISKIIKDFYFHDNEFKNTIVSNYIDYTNDVYLVYPTVKSAGYYVYKSIHPVFLMEYSRTWNNAVKHNEIFQILFSNSSFDEDETADTLKTLWINFIKLGDPTPITTARIPEVWLPVTSNIVDGKVMFNQIIYYHFDKRLQNKELNTHLFKFWDYIYNNYNNHPE